MSLFGFFLQISPIPIRTRKNILIRTFQHSYRGHNRPKTGQKWPKMVKNWHFFQTHHCYSKFFCQSYSFHSELGKIYSLRPLSTYTGAITGQKQAKNGLKWPKSAFFSNWSSSFEIFFANLTYSNQNWEKYIREDLSTLIPGP